MNSIDKLFDAFGGPAEVGRVIGKSTEHAAAMRRRGSIPVGYWKRLIKAAPARGIHDLDYEDMAAMHSRERADS